MAEAPEGKYRRLDEGVFEDEKGDVFEERGGKMVPTGAKAPARAKKGWPDVPPPTHLRTRADSPRPAPSAALAVPTDIEPVMDIEAAKKLWDQFQSFKTAIIEAGDYDTIGEKKDLNRSGWMKLAAAFAVSVEKLEESHDVVDGDPYWQFRVRASRGVRYADGVGIASLSETNDKDVLGKRMHNAITKAYTRAAKRAIADLLGGADVSE